MSYKKVIAALCCTLLLAGCSNAGSDTESATTEWAELELVSTTTECGFRYKDFLKLGQQAREVITAEHPEWVFGSDDTFEYWDYEDETEKLSYRRDLTKGISNLTVAFNVSSGVITEWLEQEKQGLDVLLNVRHTSDVIEGDHWYYTWEELFEDVQLRVIHSGENNSYVAILSINRQGDTFIDPDTLEVMQQ